MVGGWEAAEGGSSDHEQGHLRGPGEMEFQHRDRCRGRREGVISRHHSFFYEIENERILRSSYQSQCHQGEE